MTTPRFFSSSVSEASFASIPRGLNEPVRWKSSAFRWTRAPVSSDSVREPNVGVRCSLPAIVSRARRIVVAVELRHARGSAAGTASRTVKTVRRPGSLLTSTVPPIACVSSFTIASPSPVPTGRSRP